MEENLNDKSNNELLLDIKQLEANHESLKQKMLKEWDELISIEKKFEKINEILLKRLKGDNIDVK